MAQHPFSIIDDGKVEGDTKFDAQALADALASDEQAPAPANKATESQEPEWLPAKWKGKTEEERAAMYRNLESAYGRMANDLGTQRKYTDQLLFDKRERDLANNGGQPQREELAPKRKVAVTAADLLERPGEILAEQFEANEKRLEELVEKKFAAQGAKSREQQLLERHPDAPQVVQSDEFAQFIAQSKIRARAAELVRTTGDVETAEALLDEYKATRKTSAADESTPSKQEKELEAARQAALQNSGGGDKPAKGGKIYRRADLIRLKMEQPDRYAELSDEIFRAHVEGRVK